MGPPLVGVGQRVGPLQKKAPFYCESTPTRTHPGPSAGNSSTHRSIRPSPLAFSFASVRARTQDHRDILKWGALSLPTELGDMVRVFPNLTSNFKFESENIAVNCVRVVLHLWSLLAHMRD